MKLCFLSIIFFTLFSCRSIPDKHYQDLASKLDKKCIGIEIKLCWW